MVKLALKAHDLILIFVKSLEDPNLGLSSPNFIFTYWTLIYLSQSEKLRATVATVVLMNLYDVIHRTTSIKAVDLNETE